MILVEYTKDVEAVLRHEADGKRTIRKGTQVWVDERSAKVLVEGKNPVAKLAGDTAEERKEAKEAVKAVEAPAAPAGGR